MLSLDLNQWNLVSAFRPHVVAARLRVQLQGLQGLVHRVLCVVTIWLIQLVLIPQTRDQQALASNFKRAADVERRKVRESKQDYMQ